MGVVVVKDNMAVYLDYNATTPVDPQVQDVISRTLKDLWGNPNSSYTSGTLSWLVYVNLKN